MREQYYPRRTSRINVIDSSPGYHGSIVQGFVNNAKNLPVPAGRPRRAPVTINLSQIKVTDDLRSARPGAKPILNMHRNGNYSIMGHREGRSLPGYNPRRMNPTKKALERLALNSFRLANPWFRFGNVAFDIAMEIPWDNPWAYQKDQPADPAELPVIPAGWSISCFNAALPWDQGHGTAYQAFGACPGGSCTPSYTNPAQDSITNGLIPLVGAKIPNCQGDPNVLRPLNISAGPWNSLAGTPSGRYAQKIKICNNRGTDCREPRYYQPVYARIPVGVRIPWPTPTTPPPLPVIVETTNGTPVPIEPPIEPYELPAVEVSSGGMNNRPHRVLPPREGTKERKRQVPFSLAAKMIIALYDATTEASQIVDILYNNLGRKCRGAKSMSEKSNCVYRNLHTLDIDQAILDLIANHYMDKYIYGKIFGTVGKYTPFGSMLPGSKPNFNTYF